MNQLSPLKRIAIGAGAYVLLCLSAAFLYVGLRAWIPPDSISRPVVFVVAGPALSLFTHMGPILFGLQSLFVLPWLIGVFLSSRNRRLFFAVFVASWLLMGATLFNLFL